MKSRNISTLFVIVLALLVVTNLFAQTKTVVTLGGSWWNAQYSWEDESGKKIADIGAGNSVGPYISISHGKLNFGASLFFGTFPVNKVALGGAESDVTTDWNMSRGDLNFTVGYRVHQYINLFVGAKYINWTIEGTVNTTYPVLIGYDEYNYPVYDEQSATIDANLSEGGMTFGAGISGVVPFGTSGLYGFASLAYLGGTLQNETKISGGSTSQDSTYDVSAGLAAVNLGIGYRFSSGLGLNLGYRADLFAENVDKAVSEGESNPRIRVQGTILTVSYSF